MTWLPRFERSGYTLSCGDRVPCDYEGVEFSVSWLGLYVAIIFARRPRP